MGLFRRAEHDTPATAEKSSLAEAVQSARDALQQEEAALETHDAEHARLIKQFEATTTDFDQATLRGDEKVIESLVSQRFACEQKLASLDRVRGHRANQVERARQSLHQAEKDAAHEQQRHLIAEKGQLNQLIVKAVKGLAALITEAEGLQMHITQLANTWQFDRPAVRWLLPADFIRSKAGEALRNAIDTRRTFGMNNDTGRIIPEDTPAPEEELEMLLAEHVALAEEEVVHG